MGAPREFLWREFVREVETADGAGLYLHSAQGQLMPEKGVLQIAVPSEWVRSRLEDKFLDRLSERIGAWYPGDRYRVDVIVDSSLSSGQQDPTEIARPPASARSSEAGRGRSDGKGARTLVQTGGVDAATGLNPAYQFDQFVVGSSNRLAYTASLRVAERPDGRSVNPLYIYGGVGLGKTHLLQAIGNLIRVGHPKLRVLYGSAETFTNDIVEAIRNHETSVIRNKYRKIDVLLMDDIHFLQRKEQTQIEFFHTFNDLHNANKQIVLASDSNPKDMSELEERVRSRFMWGVITSIDQPEVETRTAILQRKAEELGIEDFPDDVALYIAEHVTTNIRELEGALKTVAGVAQQEERPIDLALVRRALGRDRDGDGHLNDFISTALIQQVVAEQYQLRATDLKAKRRTQRLAMARHVAMYLCREMTDLPLVEIGRDFGGRDHSTVISAYRKIQREKEADPRLAQALDELAERIREAASSRR